MESWNNKHSPKELKDLIGRDNIISNITRIFQTDPASTIVIVGPGGCGKSTLISMILREALGFGIQRYDSITHKNDRLLQQLVNINCNNVVERLLERGPTASKPTSLLIDNFDTISLSSEKAIIENIINTNIKRKLFPLILTVNSNSPKTVDELKGIGKVITIGTLTQDEQKMLIEKIRCTENIHFDDPSIIASIIAFCQGDLRLLITIMQDLSLCFKDIIITRDHFDSFLQNNTKIKNLDLHLFDSFRRLLLYKGDINKSLSQYNNDKVLLPLILQENFYKDMQNRKLSTDVKNSASKMISEYISQGDIIETYIYTDQNWHLQDMHCFISCTAPIHLLDTLSPYTSTDDIKYTMKFSSELNKTSLKNINRKNIGIICNSTRIPVSELHYVSSLFNELIKTEKYEVLRDLSANYSPDQLKFIETVIKINKCNPTIATFGTKAKKIVGLNLTSENVVKS